jgi:hypothetical protein
MTNPAPAAAPAAAPAPLSGAERDWVHARVAALGGDAGEVDAAWLPAGGGGAFPTGPSASLSAAADAGSSPVLVVDAIRVGAGESGVVPSPNGRPVKVVAGTVEVAAGGRLVMEAPGELHAARASFGADSVVVLVGADGAPGEPGPPGAQGTRERVEPAQQGGPGTEGKAGKPGGGTLYFERLAGTLTVVAGGGSGGDGGPGGPGGKGRFGGAEGGDGGAGGAGGAVGDGGTVLVAYGAIAPGGAVHFSVRVPKPGAGGLGGASGPSSSGMGSWKSGARGANGAAGAAGEPPAFIVRPRD